MRERKEENTMSKTVTLDRNVLAQYANGAMWKRIVVGASILLLLFFSLFSVVVQF